LEGGSSGLYKSTSQYTPVETEENHKRPQSEQPATWLAFEPGTSQIQVHTIIVK